MKGGQGEGEGDLGGGSLSTAKTAACWMRGGPMAESSRAFPPKFSAIRWNIWAQAARIVTLFALQTRPSSLSPFAFGGRRKERGLGAAGGEGGEGAGGTHAVHHDLQRGQGVFADEGGGGIPRLLHQHGAALDCQAEHFRGQG